MTGRAQRGDCMRMMTAAVAALTLTLLTGCLDPTNQRVRVRRDPALLDSRAVSGDADDYAEFLAEREHDETARRLDPELYRAVRLERARRRAVERVLANRTGADPWATYEDDREAVLYRAWPDARLAEPPVPEPLEGEEPAEADAPAEEEADEPEDEWGAEDDGGEDEWGW